VTDGPIGYGSKHESWEGREWEWLDAHRPDLEVRCATTRQLAGRAWNTPEGEVWYRSGTWQRAVAYWAAGSGRVPRCSKQVGKAAPTGSWRWWRSPPTGG
jgi:hypothetical protein